MKKILIPVIILLGIGMNAFAQPAGNSTKGKSDVELRGDKHFQVYSFDKAIERYTFSKKLTPEGQRRLAESYHHIDQNVQAEAAYVKLMNTPTDALPEDYINQANVLKINGKYDLALKSMDKFVELKPNDLRGKDYTAHKAEMSNMVVDNGKFKVTAFSVNTNADDFGPSYYKNKVVFASSRGNSRFLQRNFNWNRKPFMTLYASEVDGRQLKNPEIFDKNIDKKWHNGPASFSNDGTVMAFTSNNRDDKRKDKVVNLQICFSTFKDGEWSKPAPFILNNKDYAVGQPSLSADGNTMYFTSDMPGGYGGADIYRIIKDGSGNWGRAENLGDKINTEGDEMYPFFDEKNKVMYFASNGRFGLGGLDIFVCTVDGAGFGLVNNAGAPLNSRYDDFALVVNTKMAQGYFSSNRPGGSGSDDIYGVDLLNVGKRIEGVAKDKNNMPIPITFITLQDNSGNILDTMTTKNDGVYAFSVEANKNFKLIGKKEFYNEGNTVTSTFGKDFIIKADVTLLKDEVIAQKLKVGANLAEILGFTPNKIYFDYNKSDIRPDAEVDLDKIVKIMNDYPDMVVELGAYTDCRASKEYNQKLSDRRAKASADYVKKKITKPSRIYGKGYGETNLVGSCACEGQAASYCAADEYQKDRRTEFIIKKRESSASIK